DSEAGVNTLDFSAKTVPMVLDLGTTNSQDIFEDDSISLTLESSTAISNAFGTSAIDTIYGNSRDNYLFGGSGSDGLYGGDGNDILEGGAGNDYLEGDSGNDTYVFDPSGGNLGSDTVTESANLGSDTLDFSNFSDDTTVDLASTALQTIHSGELSL